MSHINMPEIIASQVNMSVVVRPPPPFWLKQFRAVGYNMCPLDKTWYEEEVDTETTRTIRFAKRSDHTGILIKIDKAEFYKLPGPPG